MIKIIQQSVEESIQAKQLFFNTNSTAIESCAHTLVTALKNGRKILLFGNGGSAADCQHIAAEFVNRFQMERNPLAAIALTCDTSILTSIGNDYSFEDIFSKQIQALGKKGDIALGITTSGNSPNVLRALEVAKERGITTVGLLGKGGGAMLDKVDIAIVVPEADTSDRIQEVHIKVLHIAIEAVERMMFPENYS